MTAPAIDRRTPVDQLPQFLTIEEVMTYLDIGRSSAYQFARQHGKRFGRLIRVPRDALTMAANGQCDRDDSASSKTADAELMKAWRVRQRR